MSTSNALLVMLKGNPKKPNAHSHGTRVARGMCTRLGVSERLQEHDPDENQAPPSQGIPTTPLHWLPTCPPSVCRELVNDLIS